MGGRLARKARSLLHITDQVSVGSRVVRSLPPATSCRLRHYGVESGQGRDSLCAMTSVPSWYSKGNRTTARSYSGHTGKPAVEDDQPDQKENEEEGEKESAPDDDASADGEPQAPQSREEELEKQVADLKDQLLRSLAEQENTRRIAKKDVDAARSFAVTSFAKSLLDTSDNLTRAMEAVPVEYRTDTENHPVLATLYEGIKMTDENLTKAFAKNGLNKFGKLGEKFDPNLHDALFEYPDPKKLEGTVGQVMKVGFMLNNRVIRPAEVGVIKKA